MRKKWIISGLLALAALLAACAALYWSGLPVTQERICVYNECDAPAFVLCLVFRGGRVTRVELQGAPESSLDEPDCTGILGSAGRLETDAQGRLLRAELKAEGRTVAVIEGEHTQTESLYTARYVCLDTEGGVRFAVERDYYDPLGGGDLSCCRQSRVYDAQGRERNREELDWFEPEPSRLQADTQTQIWVMQQTRASSLGLLWKEWKCCDGSTVITLQRTVEPSGQLSGYWLSAGELCVMADYAFDPQGRCLRAGNIGYLYDGGELRQIICASGTIRDGGENRLRPSWQYSLPAWERAAPETSCEWTAEDGSFVRCERMEDGALWTERFTAESTSVGGYTYDLEGVLTTRGRQAQFAARTFYDPERRFVWQELEEYDASGALYASIRYEAGRGLVSWTVWEEDAPWTLYEALTAQELQLPDGAGRQWPQASVERAQAGAWYTQPGLEGYPCWVGGRELTAWYDKQAGALRWVLCAQDGLGWMNSQGERVRYVYGETGLLTQEQHTHAAYSAECYTDVLEYDAQGRLSRRTRRYELDSAWDFCIVYTYGADGTQEASAPQRVDGG